MNLNFIQDYNGKCDCNKDLKARLLVKNNEFIGTFLTPLRLTIQCEKGSYIVDKYLKWTI